MAIVKRVSIPLPPTQQYILDRVTVDANGCWIWNGAIQYQGYAVSWRDGKTRRAHKESYEAFKGKVPEGLLVLHHCDVRRCVNPEHLFTGTNQANSDDMVAKGRQVKGSKQHLSRLTAKQVKSIRRRIGEPANHVAKDYNVSKQTILAIRKRKTWKHL